MLYNFFYLSDIENQCLPVRTRVVITTSNNLASLTVLVTVRGIHYFFVLLYLCDSVLQIPKMSNTKGATSGSWTACPYEHLHSPLLFTEECTPLSLMCNILWAIVFRFVFGGGGGNWIESFVIRRLTAFDQLFGIFKHFLIDSILECVVPGIRVN